MVTMQLLDASGANVDGVQATDVSEASERVMVAVCDTPFRVAVTTALEPAVKAPAVAVNVPVVAAAATVTEAGTVSEVSLLESATTLPPVGAA